MSAPPDNKLLFSEQGRKAYVKHLTREGIPAKLHSYYLLRANQFIQSAHGRHPGDLMPEDITGILEIFGRDGNLADWQFVQLVDAIRILLSVHLMSPAAAKVDWAYWKASSRSVSGDHATTAREHSPEQLAYLKIKRGNGVKAEIRNQHRQLIVRLVTEIRARGYAY